MPEDLAAELEKATMVFRWSRPAVARLALERFLLD